MNNNTLPENIIPSNNLSGQVSQQGITTEKLLQSAYQRKAMKIPEHNKIRKTKKHKPSITSNASFDSNRVIKAKNQKKTRYTIKKNPDYLEKLVTTYYDNDACVNKYLASAHRKIHILPHTRRIVVIGDIHGDFDAAVKCFILAGCIAPVEIPETKNIENMDIFFKSLKWTGADTHVVQLGDQIDRVRPRRWDSNSISQTEAHEDEGSTLEIFYLFWHLNNLAKQCKPSPGAVHCIIGNHEIMNVEGNFSYVSSAEFDSFRNHLAHVYFNNSKYPYDSRTLKNTHQTRKSKSLPLGYRERLYAFSPTGLCANFMAKNYYTLLQIGNWLFCHGSPTLSTLATYEIDLINTITSMYLLGLDSKTGNKIEYHFDKIMNDDEKSKMPTSIIWSRTFGDIQHINKEHKQPHKNDLEPFLDKILEVYNKKNNNTSIHNRATHIAIGHTPQIHDDKQLGINSICHGRVWRCDVGMSKAFTRNKNSIKDRNIQVLEIIDNKPRILSN